MFLLLLDVRGVNEGFVNARTAAETAMTRVGAGTVTAAVTAGRRTRQQLLAVSRCRRRRATRSR